MDRAVVHFRKAAARENRDRGSVRRRYSSTLQQQAVEYCRARQRQGDGLREVATARLEREFDPQVVRDLKAQLPHDISVGGPTLAAHAIRTGLVDEYHLFVVPMMIGGGKRVLPSNVCVKLISWTSAVLLMEWSIFAIARRSDRG
jgi:riboflavin biosynthesis pyrimidine reductase